MEVGFTEIKEPLQIIYVDGDTLAFVTFIRNNRKDCELCIVDGKFRWVIANEDGTKNIVRPIASKNAN